MDIIINSFYTERDVFVRELITNSCDAIDKLRFKKNLELSNSSSSSSIEDIDYFIKIKIYDDRIVFIDNGIGMSKNDLIENLGTIANSGTRDFFNRLNDNDVSGIGNFGVGFYSVFLVANQVCVESRQDDGHPYMWKSNAAGNFIITKSDLSERGTKVTLLLKPDATEYKDTEKMSSIVTKHVGFLKYPIRLYDMKSINDTGKEYQELNRVKPVWTKNKSEITRSEYEQLFKNIQNFSQNEYITSCHFNVEGSHVFTGVLFIPRYAPSNLFTYSKERKNIRLHVKNVFITDNFTDFIPEYLGFIVGIIDAENLPLNVSRENLQQNENFKKTLRQNIVRKTLEMLENLSLDSEKYEIFLSQYAKCLKYAAHEEKNYNENICKRFIDLLRFKTSFSEESTTSLSEYVSRMKENQSGIFLMTGENFNFIKESSQFESVTGAGYEVLILDDPIDVFFVDKILDYNNVKIYCIAREGFTLTNAINTYAVETGKYANFCSKIHDILKEKVEKVTVSSFLTSRACCIQTSLNSWTADMERVMRAQALKNSTDSSSLWPKKIFELNYNDNIIEFLFNMFETNENDKNINDIILILYELALIDAGFPVSSSKNFYNRLNKLMSSNYI